MIIVQKKEEEAGEKQQFPLLDFMLISFLKSRKPLLFLHGFW